MSTNALAACLQQANHLIQTARQQPGKLCRDQRKEKCPSLQQRLTDLFLTECSFNPRNKSLYSGSHLLSKLVSKEKLNCLVLNLYPGNEGYSLMLKTRTGTETETVRLPYEEDELLRYIDNEELAPVLVDLLERSQAPVFYSGCVIVEVRDHRRCSSSLGTHACHHVLLKPTTQSVLCDVGLLVCQDGQGWSLEDRVSLEAALVLATSEPLCLEPSVGVAVLSNWMQHRKGRLSSHAVHRMARRQGQVALNRRRKLERCAAPACLRAHDFISQYRKRVPLRATASSSNKQADVWKQKRATMPVPQKIEVERLASVRERPEPTSDPTPVVVQEYLLETEQASGKLTQVTILQRPTDEQFFGKLYVDRDGHSRGTSCEFNLGSQDNVNRYLNQFREIFTEEGRKPVKITHLVPGQAPVVKHTHGAPPPDLPCEATDAPQQQAPKVAHRRDSQGASVGHTAAATLCAKEPKPPVSIAAQPSEVVSLPNLSLTAQNMGLHNLVSLAGVNLSSGLPVPISLTMVPVTQSSVLVGTAGSLHAQEQPGQQPQQPCASQGASVGTSAVIVSSGMVNPASTVLTSGSGVLSMPLRVTTLGTQALTAQLVGTGMEGTTQGGQPLSLLQVPGGQQTLIGTLPRHAMPAAGPTGGHSNPQLQMALQKQLQRQQGSTVPASASRPRNRKKPGKT
uniref:Putative transcription factor spt20 n=1 Tax=Ixodes ricinus TaxID=34613 RepID=A0A147BS89_IXORI